MFSGTLSSAHHQNTGFDFIRFEMICSLLIWQSTRIEIFISYPYPPAYVLVIKITTTVLLWKGPPSCSVYLWPNVFFFFFFTFLDAPVQFVGILSTPLWTNERPTMSLPCKRHYQFSAFSCWELFLGSSYIRQEKQTWENNVGLFTLLFFVCDLRDPTHICLFFCVQKSLGIQGL